MALKARVPAGTISRSSAGLREALFQNMEALRDGTMDAASATASAKVAAQIIGTVRLDLDYAKEIKAGRVDAIESSVPMQLSEEQDAPRPQVALSPPPRPPATIPDEDLKPVTFDEPKNRRCLRCQKIFLSKSVGNRCCDTCSGFLDKAAPLAEGY